MVRGQESVARRDARHHALAAVAVDRFHDDRPAEAVRGGDRRIGGVGEHVFGGGQAGLPEHGGRRMLVVRHEHAEGRIRVDG